MADVIIREEPTETSQELSAELQPETDATRSVDAAEPNALPQVLPLPLESSVPEADRVTGAEPLPQEPLPKRKPGRPQGSKSKEPGKPRKPRAKKVEFVKEEAVESVAVVDRESSPAAAPRELPRAIPGSLPIPEEAHDLRAAKMLRLLQIHSDHRKQQKRQMYSNWFR